MGTELKMGKDGLIHVALIGDFENYSTACGADLLSTLGSCDKATCVQCTAGVVECGCGARGLLHLCGYTQEIDGQDVPCHCCEKCAEECAANA